MKYWLIPEFSVTADKSRASLYVVVMAALEKCLGYGYSAGCGCLSVNLFEECQTGKTF